MSANAHEPRVAEPGELKSAPPRVPIPGIDLWISLAILLATFASYASVFHFGFQPFDDPAYVVQNPHLRDGLTAQNLKWIFFSFSPDNWFPITRLSLVLDYWLFGLRAGRYHVENVLIHGLAALLLFGFLRRATKMRWPCAFVAFMFALHPLHVESVAWVAERKDVLCAFFWFATLWAWLRYIECPGTGRYVDALTWFSLGLMAKPMIVTLPLLLVLLDVWPFRRGVSRKLLPEKIPFAALSGAVMFMTIVAQRRAGAMARTPPVLLRVENALIAVTAYVGRTVWPLRLSAIYSYPTSVPAWQTFAAASGILAMSIFVLRQWRKRPYLAFGWFWFLLTLAPVIGLVQVGLQARADRYMYVPMTGLSIMLAWGIADWVDVWPGARRWATGLGIAACLAMSALTVIQTQYWRSGEELFQHAVEMDAENYLAWDHLGQSLASQSGFPSETISCFRNALRIRPDFAETHNNVAVVLGRTGSTLEAVAEYREALRLDSNMAPVHRNYALELSEHGQTQGAIDEYEISLRLNPWSEEAHRDMGILLAGADRFEAGIAHLEQAVKLEPDDVNAQFSLAMALVHEPGHASGSEAHFKEVLRVDPRHPGALVGLGEVLMRVPGRSQEALGYLEAAQSIQAAPALQRQMDQLKAEIISGRR